MAGILAGRAYEDDGDQHEKGNGQRALNDLAGARNRSIYAPAAPAAMIPKTANVGLFVAGMLGISQNLAKPGFREGLIEPWRTDIAGASEIDRRKPDCGNAIAFYRP